MPWPRKKTTRRSNWRRSTSKTTRAISRKANKRYNWIEILDSTCSTLQLEPRLCAVPSEIGPDAGWPVPLNCVTGQFDPDDRAQAVNLIFIPPATPATSADADQAGYQNDDITVVRLVGGIYLMPFWNLTEAALAFLAALPEPVRPIVETQWRANRSYFLRAGLKKEDCEFDPVADAYNWPSRDPWYTNEYTDGKYLRMWNKELIAGSGGSSSISFLNTGSQQGCCGDVTGTGGGGGSATNILTDGSGTIDTEIDDIDISTDCVPCIVTNASSNFTIATRPDRPIYLPMNMRKRIRLSENQGLHLVLNYSVPNYIHTPNCPLTYGSYDETPFGVGFIMRAHVKALIET